MADTKPDTKLMIDDYNKGMSPDAIGLKYGLSGQEVVDIVTKPVTDEPVVTQESEDAKVEEKKGK